ncbi:MAG: hypothetical protein KGO02_24885, partial [Alphaproteobacteria bacterium]|nr:hypothetical protein [Alphaproteobacteria bacterium]
MLQNKQMLGVLCGMKSGQPKKKKIRAAALLLHIVRAVYKNKAACIAACALQWSIIVAVVLGVSLSGKEATAGQVTVYGVENWVGTNVSCSSGCAYGYFSSPDAACTSVGANEAANGFPQYSSVVYDGTGCFDGNPNDAVSGYPAYIYATTVPATPKQQGNPKGGGRTCTAGPGSYQGDPVGTASGDVYALQVDWKGFGAD